MGNCQKAMLMLDHQVGIGWADRQLMIVFVIILDGVLYRCLVSSIDSYVLLDNDIFWN